MNKISPIKDPLKFFCVDEEKLNRGQERMSAVWKNEPPDYLPIVFSVSLTEREHFPKISFTEEWESPEHMAAKQLWGCACSARSGSDGQPTIRPNLGTGFLASVFGLDQQIFPDKMPWLQEHLSREDVERFELPHDIASAGLLPKAKRIFDFYRENLPPAIRCFLPDTQGPLDLAHLVRGDEFFYELYDAPEFVHRLMRLATDVYVEATLELMKMIDQPLGEGFHSEMYMGAGSTRMCHDTCTLLNDDQLHEFVLPYEREAFERLGGGWMHYCGKNPHLLKMALEEMPACRGINFGNPEMHEMCEVLARCVAYNKFYFGLINRLPDESLQDYFRRVLKPVKESRRGLIFVPDLQEEERSNPQDVIDLWHRLHDE
jgi:uroporphyrinogen-III decarboxylase